MDLYMQAYQLIRSVQNCWISFWIMQKFSEGGSPETPLPLFQYNSARLSTINTMQS